MGFAAGRFRIAGKSILLLIFEGNIPKIRLKLPRGPRVPQAAFEDPRKKHPFF